MGLYSTDKYSKCQRDTYTTILQNKNNDCSISGLCMNKIPESKDGDVHSYNTRSKHFS